MLWCEGPLSSRFQFWLTFLPLSRTCSLESTFTAHLFLRAEPISTLPNYTEQNGNDLSGSQAVG